tara:strand:- start:554 stop:745 length:192 start_codon:yes stop_codon:yes gene_type:complete
VGRIPLRALEVGVVVREVEVAGVVAREVVAVAAVRAARSVMIAVEETVTWSRMSSSSTEFRRL